MGRCGMECRLELHHARSVVAAGHGLDPASDEARRAVGFVRDRVTWKGCGPPECDGNPFFAGEVEPCINGQVRRVGAYFGQDVRRIVDRLLVEQLPDGGWNCEAANGSTRSSFNTTICVLEGLLEYELAGGSRQVTEARLRGEEYLLERRLFRRRSTGEVIVRDRKSGASWTRFAFPTWWHYDVCGDSSICAKPASTGRARAEAVELVESKRDSDGRWSLEAVPGVMPVETDEGGPTEPVEHAARVAGVGLVFSTRLTPMYVVIPRRGALRTEIRRAVLSGD